MKRFLKRSSFCLIPAVVVALALTVSASARPDPGTSASGVTSPALLALITNDDLFSTTDLTTVLDPTGASTQHYGPYASMSPDSGTCGNDWATDTFDRHFTVKHNSDGTFTVVEQFKNGSFVTSAGASPGSCETNLGGMIGDGYTGSMHGYFVIPMPAGETQSSTSAYCDAINSTNTDCTTATFINTHFTPACYPDTCPVTTYFFHYAAGDQGLLYHEWKDASADRGGDSGDIASS